MSDPDDHLTPHERTRRALHRAVDRIVFAWPHALTDANARGFAGSSTDPMRGSSEDTVVERAALQPCRAVGWLAEFGDVARYLTGWERLPWSPNVGNMVVVRMHGFVDAFSWADEAWIVRIITLGNQAALWWPTAPSQGSTVKGVTVGERGNDVQLCALCGDPVLGGAQDPLRRIDDDVFHKSPCWYAASVSRGRRSVA